MQVAEPKVKEENQGNIAGIVEDVMHGIAKEADSLETQMKHETFKEGANSSLSSIETVIKIDEDKVLIASVFIGIGRSHIAPGKKSNEIA